VSPRTALTAAAVVVMLAGFVGAIVDLGVTVSRIPPEPANCQVYTEACGRAYTARQERRRALEHEFRERSWFYALAVLAGALGLTGVSLLGGRSPTQRQRIFANLGVGGVVLALVVTPVWLLPIDPAVGAAYGPSLVMLAVAAFGGITAFAASGKPLEVGGRWSRLASHVSLAGLAFTGLTVVLMWIATEHVQTCSTNNQALDYLLWSAAATAVAAGLLALLGLLVRRWFLALVYLVVNPAVLLTIFFTCAG
jgi:hypothetical protein